MQSLRFSVVLPVTALLVALLASPATAGDDRLELSDGSEISGSIVKETDSNVFIDVGYTIIEVPRTSIASVTRKQQEVGDAAAVGEASGAEQEPAAVTGDSAASTSDYKVGRLDPVTVRDAVKKLGEGVVMVRCPGGQGSGFVINERGMVVTNYHVIEGERDVEIDIYMERKDGLEKKRVKDVEIVAINEFFDLALLRIAESELDDLNLAPLALGRPEDIQVGEPVFAIGAPLGLDRTVTEGIISDASRSFQGMCYIQVDVAINPGNSGGPLFNSKGEIIGVTNMGYRGMEGLNFAIPIDQVTYFIDRRASFLYDESRPNSGVHYFDPPRKKGKPE